MNPNGPAAASEDADDPKRLLLVDISALFHQAFHVSGGEDADFACRKTVARVRGIASEGGFDHVAICGDAKRNWRHDRLSTYKANRAAKPAEFGAQYERVLTILREDGYPVWVVDGFEADDVIATATRAAIERGIDVTIMTHDKDLAQLLTNPEREPPSVSILDISSGQIRTALDVAKDPGKSSHSLSNGFGVRPDQLGDWLAIVGDTSDNVPGVPGIGPKGATAALLRFGSIDGLLTAVHAPQRIVEWNLRLGDGQDPAEIERLLGPRPVVPDPPIKPAALKALKENEAKLRLSRELVGLRTDAPIRFEEALAPRKPKAPEPDDERFDDEERSTMTDDEQPAQSTTEAPPAKESQPEAASTAEATPTDAPKPAAEIEAFTPGPKTSAIVVASGPWERSLEPATLSDAMRCSKALHESRVFSATFKNHHAIFAAHLLARAHGIETMKLLMPGMLHDIQGKLTMSAVMIVGLVLRSGKCISWDLVESTTERAVYATKRRGSSREVKMEFTIEEAKAAGYLNKPGSSWQKTPKTMLRHRCETELARACYPDVVGGLFSPEEMEDAS